WFWDQPHTGSGQYLRHLLHALHKLAPELRLTLVIPSHQRTLDALPPLVDVLPLRGRFGGNLGKTMFEQRGFPSALERLGADLAHVRFWEPPARRRIQVVCTELDVISLVLREYRSGVLPRLYTALVTTATRGAPELIPISNASWDDIIAQTAVPAERV